MACNNRDLTPIEAPFCEGARPATKQTDPAATGCNKTDLTPAEDADRIDWSDARDP